LLPSAGGCGCSTRFCPTCVLCAAHCRCGKADPPPSFSYGSISQVGGWIVDPGSLPTNMTYDAQPQADEPVIVPRRD
jgi:hypothetical protein